MIHEEISAGGHITDALFSDHKPPLLSHVHGLIKTLKLVPSSYEEDTKP